MRRTAPADARELAAIVAEPRARRWGAGLAALAGLLLLAAGAAWTLGFGRARSRAYDSIAVLPFANLSGDPRNDYFGDGLAEQLLNALSGIRTLKVAARTSAFRYRAAGADVRAIGDTLGVATVLEGSVQRSADRVRISAQLIDARTGYTLWSQTYDRAREAGLLGRAMVERALRPAALAALGRMTTVPPHHLATFAMALGDRERALNVLQSVPSNDPTLAFVGVDPLFDPLRGDPRFRALLRAAHLPNGVGGMGE